MKLAEFASAVFRLAAASFATVVMAGPPVDSSPNRNPSQLDPGMSRIGTLKPRSVHDIRSSNWMLDCATFDRDYIDFKEVRDYIPTLGIKEIRFMS